VHQEAKSHNVQGYTEIAVAA